jgi:hypothetical protein
MTATVKKKRGAFPWKYGQEGSCGNRQHGNEIALQAGSLKT